MLDKKGTFLHIDAYAVHKHINESAFLYVGGSSLAVPIYISITIIYINSHFNVATNAVVPLLVLWIRKHALFNRNHKEKAKFIDTEF